MGKITLGLAIAKNLFSDFPNEPIYIDKRGSSVKPFSSEEAIDSYNSELAISKTDPLSFQGFLNLQQLLVFRKARGIVKLASPSNLGTEESRYKTGIIVKQWFFFKRWEMFNC